MKKLIFLLVTALFATTLVNTAIAADIGGTITVLEGKTVVLESTNKFMGMTDAEAAKFEKSAMAQLDYASKHQDKGGPYTMVWKWNDDKPAIETQGMTLKAVNQTLRRGTWWLASILDEADANANKGKKHWGDNKK
jgi:hypothetical protein